MACVCVCQLQKLSCLCLSKMVLDSDIRYRLLERACEVGDVGMAECLIQLGADVNKKTKTESLIYQVTLYIWINSFYQGCLSSVLEICTHGSNI